MAAWAGVAPWARCLRLSDRKEPAEFALRAAQRSPPQLKEKPLCLSEDRASIRTWAGSF